MTTDNKSKNAEAVDNDQPTAPEVVKSGITEDEVLSDIFGDDSSPATKEESEAEDETPSDAEGEGKSEEGEDDPEKKDDEDPETPAADDKTNTDEPFAKLGSRQFKTKEELVTFTSSQIGYNTWVTGELKRLHPELFNTDGSIKSKELKETIGKKAEDAATTIAEVSEKNPEDVTKEDIADVEKAKAILKPLGVVFADDPEYQTLKKNAKSIEEKEMTDAATAVTTFIADHPLLEQHREEVADLMEKNDWTLEKAWKACKSINEIEEEAPVKKNDAVVRRAADSATPVTVRKQSGSTPSSGSKDFMDDLITSVGA